MRDYLENIYAADESNLYESEPGSGRLASGTSNFSIDNEENDGRWRMASDASSPSYLRKQRENGLMDEVMDQGRNAARAFRSRFEPVERHIIDPAIRAVTGHANSGAAASRASANPYDSQDWQNEQNRAAQRQRAEEANRYREPGLLNKGGMARMASENPYASEDWNREIIRSEIQGENPLNPLLSRAAREWIYSGAGRAAINQGMRGAGAEQASANPADSSNWAGYDIWQESPQKRDFEKTYRRLEQQRLENEMSNRESGRYQHFKSLEALYGTQRAMEMMRAQEMGGER